MDGSHLKPMYGKFIFAKIFDDKSVIVPCKKRSKSATHREIIRPLKTVGIRPPMTEMIRPLFIKSAILY
jgi:hypothetical protein